MKVLIVAHDVGSKEMGMLYRPYYIAQGLEKRGHSVEIITASYSRVRKANPSIEKDLEVHSIEGINYHWLKSLKFSGNSIQRALGMILFSFKLWWYAPYFARRFKADAIIASSPHPLIVWGAHRIAKLTKGNFYFEVRDIWPLSMHELSGMKKNHPFYILCQLAEDYAYKHATKVISLLPYAYEHMKTRGLKAEKFICIPNGYFTEDYQSVDNLDSLVQQKIEGFKKRFPITVGYAGAHSLANSLGSLITAFSLLSEESKVGLILVGDGAEKAELVKMAENLKLNNVLFLDPVSKNQAHAIINCFDIAYIGLKKSPLFKYGVSPNKLTDYMALGKPVLYAIDSDKDPVQESNCGIKVPSDNPAKIAESIIQLSRLSQQELTDMGARGKNWAHNNLEYKNLIALYEKMLKAES